MLSSSHPTATVPMTSQDAHFFKALGVRIAELRREQGLSQQAVADELGIAQQTYAHYEVGRARLPARSPASSKALRTTFSVPARVITIVSVTTSSRT